DDFAQTLIDQKLPPGKISQFVIGGLIAGTLNTLGTGLYVLAFLGADPALRQKCRDEVVAVCRASAARRGDDY
ncbi:hypothetical protein ABXW19_12195, partial [Streptococcus suis]|uniref:hypothetical protein n=1 Tax=Streptococcus suis TaxID=1307 RepID=UPI003CEE3134